MRGATFGYKLIRYLQVISTHTPHAGRDGKDSQCIYHLCISTHTPHAGRDPQKCDTGNCDWNFNSHAPCGARLQHEKLHAAFIISTHTPHAGRDAHLPFVDGEVPYISTHTPHAGRDRLTGIPLDKIIDFNSHAPCGARLNPRRASRRAAKFQLTRPMRGATLPGFHPFAEAVISTHTPHAGRDCTT